MMNALRMLPGYKTGYRIGSWLVDRIPVWVIRWLAERRHG